MAAKGHFRIERRQLLEQRKEEKKKLSAPLDLRTSQLAIGTHSGCGLVVDDPVAAPTHCTIGFTGGRYVLRDHGNATGTYLNGERVVEPTHVGDGDRITLGVTILELSQDPSAPEALAIAVHEGAFFYTVKKRGEFQSDADEWVRSEVTFGRMPLLRALNGIAIVLAIVLVGGLWFTPEGHAALQPGHLSQAHAQLFSADPPSAPHLAHMVKTAAEQGCAACHDSSGAPTSSRCASCHDDLVRSASEERAHPFAAEDALDCVRCHREHYGTVPPPDALKPADMASRCVDCHGDDFTEEASVLEGIAHAVEEYGLAPSTNEPVARLASLGFEAFDHVRHAAIEDCGTCHVLRAERESGFDFETVAFEDCMGCHADGAWSGAEGHRPGVEFRWSTTWHGAGEAQVHCLECHVEPYAAALRTVEANPPVPAAFTLLTRSHHSFLDGSEGPRDCVECHKSGDRAGPQQTLEGRPFLHEQHLSWTRAQDSETRDLLNAQCAECHTGVASMSGLTVAPGTYDGPPIASCAQCHEDAGSALITLPGTSPSGATSRRVTDFPHDRHTTVEGGCVACHELGTDPSGGFAILPPPADVASCVRCHVERQGDLVLAHAAIGGGHCAACHRARGDASPSSPMAAVFYEPLPAASVDGGAVSAVTADGPSSFPHGLEAHATQSCVECHGDPRDGGDVHSPQVIAASCRECHAQQRFHWR